MTELLFIQRDARALLLRKALPQRQRYPLLQGIQAVGTGLGGQVIILLAAGTQYALIKMVIQRQPTVEVIAGELQ
ncbi:hypothetical protein N4G58_10845 [Edwardsiella piscicida]|nr:hypothetical protein N4G58_10845 [Edwardsiella piscicida]